MLFNINIFFIAEETMEIDSTPDKTVEVKTELKTEKPKTETIDLVEKVIEKELPKEDAILHYLGQLSCALISFGRKLT